MLHSKTVFHPLWGRGHYLPGKEESRVSGPLRVDQYGLMVSQGRLPGGSRSELDLKERERPIQHICLEAGFWAMELRGWGGLWQALRAGYSKSAFFKRFI